MGSNISFFFFFLIMEENTYCLLVPNEVRRYFFIVLLPHLFHAHFSASLPLACCIRAKFYLSHYEESFGSRKYLAYFTFVSAFIYYCFLRNLLFSHVFVWIKIRLVSHSLVSFFFFFSMARRKNLP